MPRLFCKSEDIKSSYVRQIIDNIEPFLQVLERVITDPETRPNDPATIAQIDNQSGVVQNIIEQISNDSSSNIIEDIKNALDGLSNIITVLNKLDITSNTPKAIIDIINIAKTVLSVYNIAQELGVNVQKPHIEDKTIPPPQKATEKEMEQAGEEIKETTPVQEAALSDYVIKTASADKRIDKSDNEWLGLYETNDGYVYAREIRGSGTIVGVLGYRELEDDKMKFLGRFEKTPAHGDTKVCLKTLTGMVEENESHKAAAVRELKEESGIVVGEEDLIDLGIVKPSKAMDSECHLFAVDIEDKNPKNTNGDGTKLEKEGYCKMVTAKDIARSQSAILCAALLKLIDYLS